MHRYFSVFLGLFSYILFFIMLANKRNSFEELNVKINYSYRNEFAEKET